MATALAFPFIAGDLVAFLFWVFAAGNFTLTCDALLRLWDPAFWVAIGPPLEQRVVTFSCATQLYFALAESIPAFLAAGVRPSPS